MILDYSQYINREGHRGLMNNIYRYQNDDMYGTPLGVCPFCNKQQAILIHNVDIIDRPMWLDGTFRETEMIWKCPNCGWWEYHYQNQSDAMNEGLRFSEIKIRTAVLRKYELGDKHIPIHILNDYIQKNPEKIYGIHHGKMEELTQSVFREHYNCEVELVGKSHDGGKDLILVNSDDPIIVQVKRRTQPDKVEPVSTIRELLGATQLAEARSCIFVSTADHFSGPAVAAAEKALQLKLVDRYDLIDYHSFIDMLNLQQNKDISPWKGLITMTKNSD